jgi:hypothetical protein
MWSSGQLQVHCQPLCSAIIGVIIRSLLWIGVSTLLVNCCWHKQALRHCTCSFNSDIRKKEWRRALWWIHERLYHLQNHENKWSVHENLFQAHNMVVHLRHRWRQRQNPPYPMYEVLLSLVQIGSDCFTTGKPSYGKPRIEAQFFSTEYWACWRYIEKERVCHMETLS